MENQKYVLYLSEKLDINDNATLKIVILDILLRLKARLRHQRLEERFKNDRKDCSSSLALHLGSFMENPVFIENVSRARKLAKEELVKQKAKQLLLKL
jgi:hypothetical protein